MARKVRIEYPGAVYHVMSRGDHQEAIFRDDKDRQLFLSCLEEACKKTRWQIHAYVLMGNHYHLLLETPQANLIAGMKWLQGTYTQRFNSRHKIFGHLFQGRYKAVNVDAEEDAYLQVLSTYIHLNPVRGGLIRIGQESLQNYRWSSYPAYLVWKRHHPKWLRVDRVLGSLGFASDDGNARRGYRAYLEGRVLELGLAKGRKEWEAKWKQVRRGWYLGEASFKERLLDHMGSLWRGRKKESISGEAVWARKEWDGEQCVKKMLQCLKVDEAGLRVLPKGAKEKLVMAWWLRRHTTLPRAWIAARLQMGHETRVTLAVRVMSAVRGGASMRLRKQIEESVGESI